MAETLIEALKRLFAEETISSNCEAGRVLDAHLTAQRMNAGVKFKKTEEIEKLGKVLGRSQKKLFQSIQFYERWREYAKDADAHAMSLGRAIDLLPGLELIAIKEHLEKSELKQELLSLIESCPGAVRKGPAVTEWNDRAKKFLSNCGKNVSGVQSANLQKSKKTAISELEKAIAGLGRARKLLPAALPKKADTFAKLIDEIATLGANVSELFDAALEQADAEDAENMVHRPTKHERRSPLDEDMK